MLTALTLAMVALAIVVMLGVGRHDVIGRLPVAHDTDVPEVSLIVAVVAGAAAFFVALAALHAAATMRVLARDRRIPAPFPSELRGLRALVVMLMAPFSRGLVKEQAPPPTSLLEEGTATGPLRLTVLVPAHDESVTIAATLESLWGQTRPPDRVIVVEDNCTDDTADIARRHGSDSRRPIATSRNSGTMIESASMIIATSLSSMWSNIFDRT